MPDEIRMPQPGTNLKVHRQAYATVTIATYEPLILRWVSAWELLDISDVMATRLLKRLERPKDPNPATDELKLLNASLPPKLAINLSTAVKLRLGADRPDRTQTATGAQLIPTILNPKMTGVSTALESK